MNIEMKAAERKALVNRLGELTGIKPHYNGVPSCTYAVGDYLVEKDGSITVEDEKADMDILNTLAKEDLIEKPEILEEEEAAPRDLAPAEEEDEETTSAEEQEAEEEPETDTFPVKTDISLPLEGQTGTSIRNLINELYSRGSLINKAISSDFTVSEDLVKDLQDDQNTTSLETALGCFKNHEDETHGIEFTDDKITFTGFPEADSPEEVRAFMDLSSLMVKAAKDQKRIMAKEVDDSNEKYITRIWLLRLGMKGDEYRETRKILLQNLSGHIAFRTQEQVEAAKEKAKAKRAAEKALQTSEGGENDEISE